MTQNLHIINNGAFTFCCKVNNSSVRRCTFYQFNNGYDQLCVNEKQGTGKQALFFLEN